MSGKVPQDSEEQRLLAWLETQGYSLQMRVARVFTRAGFHVSQFASYVDPKEHKLREIDVVASMTREFDGFTLAVAFLIECKHADKPWVVFTSPKPLQRWFHFSRVLRERFETRNWQKYETLQSRLVARILACSTGADFARQDVFPIPNAVGNTVVESHKPKDKKDHAYDAMMQVSSCIQAYDIEDELMFQRSIEDYANHADHTDSALAGFSLYARILLPVVIAGGHLFECCLDQDGSVVLSRVQDSVVIVPDKDPGDDVMLPSWTSAVRIVAEEHVDSFAKKAYMEATALLSQEEAIRDLWNFEKENLTGRPAAEELPF